MRIPPSVDSILWMQPGIGSRDAVVVSGLDAKSPQRLYREVRSRLRIFELEQGTEDWLDWRRGGIGASESAAALGLNPYESPQKLYDLKTQRIGADADNSHMQRGRRLEPEARAVYEGLMGFPVVPLCIVHDSLDWLKASLDGYNAQRNLIVEIKCPTLRNHERNLAGNIPEYYRCQMQHQLLATQASVCHFVSYCPDHPKKGQRLYMEIVRPDREFQAWLLTTLQRFWSMVEAGEPPPEGFPWEQAA